MANIEQLSYCVTETNVIRALDNKPNTEGGLTASQLKAKFDAAADGIKGYLNSTLVDFVNVKIVSTINSLASTSDELVAAKHTHANKALLDSYAQDSTPTSGSSNVVTSDGLYKAVPKVVSGTGIDVSSSYDTNGKLTYTPSINKIKLLDYIYPIGSIYMSMNNVSPASFLGGTWERIQGRFLLAAGTYTEDGTTYTYSAGATGGEETHTLTVSEMPRHRHSYTYRGETDTAAAGQYTFADEGWTTNYTSYAGGGQPHNNMPPYLAVYVWKRTA